MQTLNQTQKTVRFESKHYFNSSERIKIYAKLQADSVAYSSLRKLPYSVAIEKYAMMTMKPEELSIQQNIHRIMKDIIRCKNQMAHIDKDSFGVVTNKERYQLKKAWIVQKQKLIGKKLQFAALAASALEQKLYN